MDRKILITGGAGFVGSNLAIHLKRQLNGNRVICFDNLIRPGSVLNVARLEDEGITFIKGDIRAQEQLQALPQVDLIIECSAEPSVLASYENPSYTLDTNLLGTIHCLELARRDRADFIFCSTNRVYPVKPLNSIPYQELDTRYEWVQGATGPGYSPEGIRRDFPVTGVKSLYGATKLCSEQLTVEFADMFGFKSVINRFGVMAGPWQMGKIDQGFVGYWMARHKYGGTLDYIGFGGTGKQVRDVLHIDDVCALIQHQITHMDSLNGCHWNVGGGKANALSLLELSRRIQAVTGKTAAVGSVPENRQSDLRIYITDNAEVREKTGWTPVKTIDTILEDMHQWMDAHEEQLKEVFV